ncbi:hypothetical protein [Streptomyces sp. NBC_00286]|uniref:hypothetical protein n=1 Tax=Streptomyces sp. NBC_00286 TaxID=2975701 RepID=UPI002E2AA8F0|nr:hypothetical protein [Streptomyces sp. NBC_00286]
MFLEALGSVILGLAVAWLAMHRLSHRLPAGRLVLSTGAAGGLFGAFLTNSALSGTLLLTLIGAATVATASVSLLLRPAGRLRRHSATV